MGLYSNDRKAPRMKKAEFSTSVINRDLFKRFIVEFPEYKNLSWEEFIIMWDDLAELIRSESVENPLGLKLPSFMGELKLQFLPYKLKTNDQLNSELLGEKVNHVNLVTSGKVSKMKWERRWAVKFNKILQFYSFSPTRKLVALCVNYINKNPSKIRVSRNTLGGYSVWRQLKNYESNKKGSN